MARKKAGKVMILPRGDWNASVAYTMLDLVHIPNSATYLAVKDVPAGTAVTNRTYWQEICNTTGLHGDIANTYSASATYDVGDYVMYDGILYTCKTAITSGEAWNSAHWTRAVLGDDLSALKSQTDSLKIKVDTKADAIEQTVSGNIVTFDDAIPDTLLKKIKVNIEPVQRGTGDPSPDNVRPITGFTGANIQRCNNAFASLWDIDSSFKGSVVWNQLFPIKSDTYSWTDWNSHF